MALREGERREEEEEQKLENDDDNYNYDDEEAEALSLSDLPIMGESENYCENKVEGSSRLAGKEAEEFEFGSWVDDDTMLMCAADEVFFKGQILPLRLSVSSESGFLSRKSSRCGSRCESLDRSSVNGSSLFSSRSQSLSSTSSSSNNNNNTINFYTKPSPKPQMGRSEMRSSAGKSCRRSSGWGVLRLGLVRTPELELHDLRFRSRHSSSERKSIENILEKSNSGRKSTNNTSEGVNNRVIKTVNGRRLHRLFSNSHCKCSADAVDTVSMTKSNRKEQVDNINTSTNTGINTNTGEGLEKQAISQRRTFEWLRQLSVAEAPVS